MKIGTQYTTTPYGQGKAPENRFVIISDYGTMWIVRNLHFTPREPQGRQFCIGKDQLWQGLSDGTYWYLT